MLYVLHEKKKVWLLKLQCLCVEVQIKVTHNRKGWLVSIPLLTILSLSAVWNYSILSIETGVNLIDLGGIVELIIKMLGYLKIMILWLQAVRRVFQKQNSKNKNVRKIKKTQNVKERKNSKCDKIKKIKMWQKSRNQ